MSDELILVLGATGTTGRRLTRRLRAAGVAVRAASRHGEARFDWSDPTTWDAAVTGVTRIYLMAPHEVPIDPLFVRRAVEHGVRHITLLSSRGIEAMGDERLMAAERTVRESGVDWTILRPDWFDQNFDEGFLQPAVMAGGFALPVGETGFAFVDADDIAAVAAAVLTTDGHAGQSYELTGPDSLPFAEAVRIISETSGRPVRFGGTDDDYLAQQAQLGEPEEQARQALAAFTALRELGDQPPTDAVHRIAGHPPKAFRAYAEEAAARGAWDTAH
ncbi:NAD(P)H-binding protein [Phytohabitans sp. LJ34]|uniref:NAD(P)H-binding protein n=1 Tax=Phytohabitans sp. LJ34 TaxID=3452217 RepID=UPI003F8BC06D